MDFHLEGDEMFDFLKKFKKECVNTSEQLENTEEEIEKPVKQEKPIIAIIDGLLYDTSKAIKILEFCDTAGCGMYWINKTLYITNSKRFFYTDNWGTLRKLSDDEAKTILSKYPDKYQEIFGKVEEA